MRIVVVGGAGNFGARVVRALRGDPSIELLVAGRRIVSVPAAEDVPGVLVDIDEAGFGQVLKALSPGLVIHCVGPFQGQDYRVSNAALAAGAHYLDLADARRFITEFAAGMNDHAVRVSQVAIYVASTLPALSSAVVDALRVGLSSLESIEAIIAPGQRAPRGKRRPSAAHRASLAHPARNLVPLGALACLCCKSHQASHQGAEDI